MSDTSSRPSDQRDHWTDGAVRHLRLEPDANPNYVYAMRVEHDGGPLAGGSVDAAYTLVIHPDAADNVESVRSVFEDSLTTQFVAPESGTYTFSTRGMASEG